MPMNEIKGLPCMPFPFVTFGADDCQCMLEGGVAQPSPIAPPVHFVFLQYQLPCNILSRPTAFPCPWPCSHCSHIPARPLLTARVAPGLGTLPHVGLLPGMGERVDSCMLAGGFQVSLAQTAGRVLRRAWEAGATAL